MSNHLVADMGLTDNLYLLGGGWVACRQPHAPFLMESTGNNVNTIQNEHNMITASVRMLHSSAHIYVLLDDYFPHILQQQHCCDIAGHGEICMHKIKRAVCQAIQMLKPYKCDKNITWVYTITGS